MDTTMNAPDILPYANRGNEVPLGVECALPYLDAAATFIARAADSREHAGMHPLPACLAASIAGR
jgi:hypothetical protein